MIKQAIISAGGLGTRLRPYTDVVPKPMIPILGKPLLEWHIEQFKKYGVTEFFLTLHHLPKVITDYFGDGSKFGVKIHYFVEEKPLDTAGGIKKFENQLDDLFFYIYGDSFSMMDYGKMEEAYAKKKDPIGMHRVQRSEDYADADVAELDKDGKFIAIHPKPHTRKIENAYRTRGSFIFNKKILRYIPENAPFHLGQQLLPAVISAGKNFYGYECGDYLKGIDTVEKWEDVEAHLVSVGAGKKLTASILMTTYRHPIFIGRAIGSIQKQTLQDWELIIVDDSEDDATERTVEPFAAKDERIRYFHRKEKGNIANASNFGLRHARGEFVAVLDDDDYWTDNHKLQKQVDFLRTHPDHIACGGWFIGFDEHGKEIARFKKPETDAAIRRVMLSANAIANSTSVFRRKEAGFYDESMSQFADADFFRRLGTIGKLYNFPEYFLAYRMWDKGSSFVNQRGNADAAVRMFWRYHSQYPGAISGFISAYGHWLYAHLPKAIRSKTDSFMSRLKKALFAR